MMESGRKSTILPTGHDWRADAAEYTLKHLIFSDRERKAFIAWCLNLPTPLKIENIMTISASLKTWKTSRRRLKGVDDDGHNENGNKRRQRRKGPRTKSEKRHKNADQFKRRKRRDPTQMNQKMNTNALSVQIPRKEHSRSVGSQRDYNHHAKQRRRPPQNAQS